MLSVTHLLVLGFAVMVMFGAVQQLLPVLAGVTFRHPERISISLYAGLVSGVLSLCAGLFLGNTYLLSSALLLLLGTVAAFFIIMMLGLLRSQANRESIQGIRLALISFLVSASLGLYLGAGHTLPDILLARNLTPLHLAWGLLGWIGLLVIAVSYQVVPMFQITPKYPKVLVRWLSTWIFVGLALWSLTEFAPVTASLRGWISVASEAGITVGLLAFCLVTIRLQQQRRRKLPDITLDFFRLALTCLMFAMLNWWIPEYRFSQAFNSEVLTGGLLIVGFTMSVISGMLYKIVPFLIWLHLTNQIDMSERWERDIPNMKQIIAELHARRQFRLHLGSVLLMIVALYMGPWILRLAAVTFLISNLYLLRNLIVAVTIYRNLLRIHAEKESP